jgi:hypothetical protein
LILVTKEILESLRSKFRISNRVHDVLVPHVALNAARVLTVVSAFKSAGVAQHMGMDPEGKAGPLAKPSD